MKKLLLIICMLSFPVLADPVTWTIDGLTNDGGTITGSFVFDEDTTLYSDILINYVGGNQVDMTFTFALFQSHSGLAAVEAEATDYIDLRVMFLEAVEEASLSLLLTDAGGSFNFEDHETLELYLATCFSSNCEAAVGSTPKIVTGTLIGIATVGVPTSVPEPGSMVLLVSGLAVLGAIRRRKRSLI